MSFFYIADLHLRHANVITFDNRPFSDVDQMESTIIENWNNTVTQNDTVFILGDMIWDKESMWPEVLAKLQGNKILIKGNHDPKEYSKQTRRFFQDIKDYKEITDSEKHVILSHYPMPFHKAAYNENCWMLYGHVHTTREYTFMRKLRQEVRDSCCEHGHARGNFINVGCMMPWMDYTPRTLNDIINREAKWYEENPHSV